MEDDEFSNVSWQRPPHGNTEEAGESSGGVRNENGPSNGSRVGQASEESRSPLGGDHLDLAGVGSGTLECTVSSPIKENDGTKDSYVSYLVTTHVCTLSDLSGLR
jgi:sorting nexin-4